MFVYVFDSFFSLSRDEMMIWEQVGAEKGRGEEERWQKGCGRADVLFLLHQREGEGRLVGSWCAAGG